jgi:hypothetical protein
MDVQITCVCPDKDGQTRHPDGDRLTLRDKLDFHSVRTMRNEVRVLKTREEEASTAEILATLTEAYLIHGIESWTLVDDKGKPLEVSRRAINDRLLPTDAAEIVGDAADELYQEVVLLPLVARGQNSSPTTPTNGSTSATTVSSSKPPKPSKRSSISTTRTVATETTSLSLVGVSNSSQSSESAA